jgi:negative regulator of sigma E activity
LKIQVLLLLVLTSICVASDTATSASDAIVENYCAAARGQQQLLKGASMDMEIDAALPQLKKRGKLHALRRISALGRITYEFLRFEGDGTVKSQVITRYLTAEAETQKEQAPSLAVTPENYKFKYKGKAAWNGRDVHVFQVTPRQKRQGLFKGEVWIDAATYLRVRESGYLVKNPSIFLKRVEFVRNYEIRDGIAVPRRVESVVETRLVGKAELTIDFTNFSIDGSVNQAAAGEAGGQ